MGFLDLVVIFVMGLYTTALILFGIYCISYIVHLFVEDFYKLE